MTLKSALPIFNTDPQYCVLWWFRITIFTHFYALSAKLIDSTVNGVHHNVDPRLFISF